MKKMRIEGVTSSIPVSTPFREEVCVYIDFLSAFIFYPLRTPREALFT